MLFAGGVTPAQGIEAAAGRQRKDREKSDPLPFEAPASFFNQ
jgi:hypothetical protein